MCDIFLTPDLKRLCNGKYIMFVGSSNTRALYKDVVWLWNNNSLISQKALKSKLEPSFMGDRLLKGEHLVRGRDYEEVREYKHGSTTIGFHFITKCYTKAIVGMLSDIQKGRKVAPDVIIYNSCLWDITRWGPHGVQDYKDNLVKLLKEFKKSLPKKTLVIWVSTDPVSNDCRGALFVKQVEFMKHYLRFEVMEANLLARQLVVSHGFDFLDSHYYLRMQLHRRAADGVHWLPAPVRHITNLVLTHIALSWEHPLPQNFKGLMLDKAKSLCVTQVNTTVKLPDVPTVLKTTNSKTNVLKLNPPAVCGSPFRVSMKAKLKKSQISITVDGDKENAQPKLTIQKDVNCSGCDTPKRHVEVQPNNLIKMNKERSVKNLLLNRNIGSNKSNTETRSRTEQMKEPDFTKSPLLKRNFQVVCKNPSYRSAYRTFEDFSSGNYSNFHDSPGPVRHRERHRNQRRRQPYYYHV